MMNLIIYVNLQNIKTELKEGKNLDQLFTCESIFMKRLNYFKSSFDTTTKLMASFKFQYLHTNYNSQAVSTLMMINFVVIHLCMQVITSSKSYNNLTNLQKMASIRVYKTCTSTSRTKHQISMKMQQKLLSKLLNVEDLDITVFLFYSSL